MKFQNVTLFLKKKKWSTNFLGSMASVFADGIDDGTGTKRHNKQTTHSSKADRPVVSLSVPNFQHNFRASAFLTPSIQSAAALRLHEKLHSPDSQQGLTLPSRLVRTHRSPFGTCVCIFFFFFLRHEMEKAFVSAPCFPIDSHKKQRPTQCPLPHQALTLCTELSKSSPVLRCSVL